VDDFPDTPIEQAKSLETLLLAACQGDRSESGLYELLRSTLMSDAALRSLLPEFVRTCRSLDHVWTSLRSISAHWAPRRKHVHDAMIPLFNHLEGINRAPIDAVAADTLQKFDAPSVHDVWEKALSRRHADPDGAITSARTLLETVCKRILDEADEAYSDKDDLPGLYRAAALKLNIAPSQHSEEPLKRILGGVTSVVEGLGSLRNKIGDAHGQGRRPVRPSARHAQLAVNLAGAVATFLVETWNIRSGNMGKHDS
jgi:Abortive infection C-terminus